MVAAGIIYQDRQTNLYTMPRDHQEVLKIQSAVAPMFPLYASRSELVKKCFRKDGPYGNVFNLFLSNSFFYPNSKITLHDPQVCNIIHVTV